ncbi:MAG: DUF1499 domain-containing protein [Acidobacteriota bacterium]|nr:DUF1499 domain-containing protein [Acidobacteriota bacterium]
MAQAKSSRRTSPVVLAGAGLSVLGAIVLAMSGPGYRMGWWPLGMGFNLLRWAAYVGIGGAVVSLAGALVARPGSGRGGFGLAVLGVLVGGVVFWMPYSQMRTAGEVPRIHDITTDTVNPPSFVAVLPLRAGAPNSAVYAGAALAAQQEKAYPDIKPLLLSLPPDQVFDKALAVAQSMGWHIDGTDRAAGRIEATATTFWFGFKDDIVIRIQADPGGGTRVDMRSESRIGRSDIGTNARRIRKYLAALKAAA